MALALLIAGIFAVLAGLLAILFGFTVREFSLGSTLIISGTIGVCSGMLLAGLYVVVAELKGMARRLAGSIAPSDVRVRPVLPGLGLPGTPAAAPEPTGAEKMEPAPPLPAAGPPPWQNEAAARERPRVEPPPPPEAPSPPEVPEPPRRRNLLFASTSRKERERAEAKTGEGVPPLPPAEPSAEPAPEAPPASFDDAWPKPDRMRPAEPPAASRRPPSRSPSTFAEAAPPPAPEPAAAAEQAPVTVLKSGIVDGMAYSLYSDGSIEAQMPEGMMRFASIDELRSHLDQRGA